MKKTLRKIVSSALAAAMVVTSCAMMNVAAFAADEAVTDYAQSTDFAVAADNYDSNFTTDAVLCDNDYATVSIYGGGKNPTLKVGTAGVTVNGVTFAKKFQTNSQKMTFTDGAARTAFKVVTKQPTRILFVPAGGTSAIRQMNDDGTSTVLKNDIAQNTVAFVDVEAGKTVYLGQKASSTNNSCYAVGIEAAATDVTVTPKITLGTSGEALPSGAKLTIGDDETEVTANEDGTISYAGKTKTTFDVSYKVGSKVYSGTLTISKDGNCADTLNLKLTSDDASVTVKTADGTPVVGKNVVLTYYNGSKPEKLTATTDENGVASFISLATRTYGVEIAGYSSATTEFNPENGSALVINDAALSGAALPSDASSSNLYVGYIGNDTIQTYDTVQEAVDNATEGQTIYVAEGDYYETVEIDKSVNIIGAGKDTTTIRWDDSAAGNDALNPARNYSTKVRFHGDTVYMSLLTGTVSFKNIKIQNCAYETLGDVKNNATALSAYTADSKGQAITVNVDNCIIDGMCDTVYTGTRNGTGNTWTINNTEVTGFQDIVCGTGFVTLNDCTWTVNKDSDARIFVPNASNNIKSVMTANNLTINTTVSGLTADVFLGRPWNDSSATDGITTTQVIVNGYTDNTGKVPDVVNGFVEDEEGNKTDTFGVYDYTMANIDTAHTLADCNWLARKNENDEFVSTNTVNALDTANCASDGDGAYRLVGVVSPYEIENATEVGFIISDGTTDKEILSDTVYTLNGDTSKYYAVAYVTGADGATLSVQGEAVANEKHEACKTTSVTVPDAAATASETEAVVPAA